MSQQNMPSQLRTAPPPHPSTPPHSQDLWGDFCRSIEPAPRSGLTGDEMYRTIWRSKGLSEEEIEEALVRVHERGNAFMLAGGPPVLGGKPQEGDKDVHYYSIPGDRLSVRIWPGGLDIWGQYCLDFYDRNTKEAVNTPHGYQMMPIARPGTFVFPGPLKTWEAAMACGELKPGAEKYSVLEGTCLRLQRPGRPDFCFAIPRRDVPGLAVAMPDGYGASL